jgi:FkbM family methyltransferase
MLTRFVVEHRIPVLKRLLPGIKRLWAQLTWTGGFRVVRRGGVLLLLNHRNKVDRSVALIGHFENAQLAHLRATVDRHGCDVFFDVGANFGLYTVHLGHHPRVGAVEAFEPDIRNYNQLCGNIFLNALSERVTAHRAAVSERAGTVQLQPADGSLTGLSRVAEAGPGTVPVPSVALDGVVDRQGGTLVFKIDVEGHELAVLRGAVGLLKRNRCYLQVESFPENVEAVKDFFARNGYRHLRSIRSDHYFTNLEA